MENIKYEEKWNYPSILMASVRDVQSALRLGMHGKTELMILTSILTPPLLSEIEPALFEIEKQSNIKISKAQNQYAVMENGKKIIKMNPKLKKTEHEIYQLEVMKSLTVIIAVLDKHASLLNVTNEFSSNLLR